VPEKTPLIEENMVDELDTTTEEKMV